MVSIVQNAAKTNTLVRASRKGHMWYNTIYSDGNRTIIIQVEGVHRIRNLDLAGGSVVIEAA
jgi:hypothetical protein